MEFVVAYTQFLCQRGEQWRRVDKGWYHSRTACGVGMRCLGKCSSGLIVCVADLWSMTARIHRHPMLLRLCRERRRPQPNRRVLACTSTRRPCRRAAILKRPELRAAAAMERANRCSVSLSNSFSVAPYQTDLSSEQLLQPKLAKRVKGIVVDIRGSAPQRGNPWHNGDCETKQGAVLFALDTQNNSFASTAPVCFLEPVNPLQPILAVTVNYLWPAQPEMKGEDVIILSGPGVRAKRRA